MKTRDVLAVFNRGRISKYAMARQDVSRVALSADVQTNWLPRTLGSMSLRPGWRYRATVGDGVGIPFIYATDDTALLDLRAGTMRIYDDGTDLVTRSQVGTSVSNQYFTSALTDWTDDDGSGAASTWETGGYMKLLGTGSASARRYQQVSVTGDDVGVVHALRIAIERGPVLLRVGSSAGADDVFRQAVLRTGVHSIAFQADADFYVQFSSSLDYPVLVDSCVLEAVDDDTPVSLPTPWSTVADCKKVRWQQSGDVVFAACEGYRPRRIERRPNNSWSIVEYAPEDGPFRTENTSSLSLTPSALSGEITLTASETLFQSGHEGALFQLTSEGQTVSSDLAAELTYTNSIRVTGVGKSRLFSISITGTWSGTITLQESIAEEGSWSDTPGMSWTANASTTHKDIDDNNQIVYYRIGFKAGDYTSGTATVTLQYDGGSITGVVQVTDVASATSATANVISDLGEAAATTHWAEGAWSDVQGWPEAVTIWEGRLWWPSAGRNYASVSDALESFDPDYEGDAGPINRRVGDGPALRSNWMLPLQRLIVGTDQAEFSIRSNSFDEPVTPSNYNSKEPTSKGSAPLPAVKADGRGYFVDRSTKRLFEMAYNGQTYDFGALDLTVLVPEIGEAGFARIAVQSDPDFRVHAVREDGTVGILVRDPAEEVICWTDIETDGDVEDVVVLPSDDGDRVFYRVKRTIDGNTVRYLEEWAAGTDCVGGTLNLQADSFITGAGAVDGLDHLEGETVVIWGDGEDQGTGVVSSGAVSGQSHTSWMAGLTYDATYKSAKLATQLQDGTTLTQRARINSVGLILVNTHPEGLQVGPTFDTMDALPLTEGGAAVDTDDIWETYDEGMVEFPGDWTVDPRICMKASSPRNCAVSAAIISVDWQSRG